MKQTLPIFFLFILGSLSAQDCAKPFFSGYVEGSGNNKALEIYNPTSDPIQLSNYSIGRFSNGTTYFEGVQLPDVELAANDVFVAVLDKRDPDGEGNEQPVWDGYLVIELGFDDVTGDTVFNEITGEPMYFAVYDTTATRYMSGDVYYEDFDLQGKADAFLTPVYAENNAMYFNGNDAVAIIEGTEISDDGSNILDVIGVIGEDPEATIGEEAWVNADGTWLTRNKTLKRNADVLQGSVFIAGGSDDFDGSEWMIYPNNTFNVLGSHSCDCHQQGTGLADYELVDIRLFPNPSQNFIAIEASQNIESIEIINALGQVVQQALVETVGNKVVVPFQSMPQGSYMVKVVMAGEKQMALRSFIVQ